jgi:hypothetical protein
MPNPLTADWYRSRSDLISGTRPFCFDSSQWNEKVEFPMNSGVLMEQAGGMTTDAGAPLTRTGIAMIICSAP